MDEELDFLLGIPPLPIPPDQLEQGVITNPSGSAE
jgi:hypothetical protein